MYFEISEAIKIDLLYCQKTLVEYMHYYQMWIKDLQNVKKDNRTKRVSSLYEREISHIGRDQNMITDRLRLEVNAYVVEMQKRQITVDPNKENTSASYQIIEYFDKYYSTNVTPKNAKLRMPAEEFYGKHLYLLGELSQVNDYARATGRDKLASKKQQDKIEELMSVISMPNKYINNNNIVNNPQSTNNHPQMFKQVSLLKPKSKCISLLSKRASRSSTSPTTTINSSALLCTPILTQSPTMMNVGDGADGTIANPNNNTYFNNSQMRPCGPSSSSSPYLLEQASSSSVISQYLTEPVLPLSSSSISLSSPSLTQTFPLATDPVALLSTLVLPSSTSVTILPPRSEITTANINNSRMNLLQALKKAKIQVHQSNLKTNTRSTSTTSSSIATAAITKSSSISPPLPSSSSSASSSSTTKKKVILPKKPALKRSTNKTKTQKKSAKLKTQKRKATSPLVVLPTGFSSSSSISPSSSPSSLNTVAVPATAANSTTSIVKKKKNNDRSSLDSQTSLSSSSHDSALLEEEKPEPEFLDKEPFLRIFGLYTPACIAHLKTRRSKRRRRQIISTARGDFHYGKFDLTETSRNKLSILYSPPATRANKRRKRMADIEKSNDIIYKDCKVLSSLPLLSSSTISAAPTSSSAPTPSPMELTENPNEKYRICRICLKNGKENKLNDCKLCNGVYHMTCHSNSLNPELLQHHENICPKCVIKPMVDLS